MDSSKQRSKTSKPKALSRLFSAALLIASCAAAFWLLAPDTVGEQVRRHLLGKLQSHYKDYDVTIGRGRFKPDVGFVFEDLVIRNPNASSAMTREMVRINHMVVFANLHPEKLLKQTQPITTTRIVLKGVTANTVFDQDGNFSLSSLLPLPEFGPVCPRIDVLGGKLNVFDPTTRGRPLAATINQLTLKNDVQMDGGVHREITSIGTSDVAEVFNISIVDTDDTKDVRAAIRGLKIDQNLFSFVPTAFSESLSDVRGLQCAADLSVSLLAKRNQPIDYRLRSTIHDGTFSHAKLPRRITDLRGVVNATPHSIGIEASQAMLGDAVVRVSGQIAGHQPGCDANLRVSTNGLLIDEGLAMALPQPVQAFWNKFKPQGRVDVHTDVVCRDERWGANGTIDCKGLDVNYWKFPYPVQNLVGRIHIDEGFASSESLVGRIDNRRMECAFRAPLRPEISNEKTFVIAADQPIAINDALFRAMSPRGSPQTKLETFARSLRARGMVHLVSATFGTNVNGQKTREMDLRIVDGYLRYEKFSYPVDNVEGQLIVSGDTVKLKNFQGMSSNSGVVKCEGTYRIPSPSAEPSLFRIANSGSGIEVPPQLALAFQVANLPMDDTLRQSLPESTRRTWDALAPSGLLDEADVFLTQQAPGQRVKVNLTARQLYAARTNNRMLSLRPTALPYRIDLTKGMVQYDSDASRVDIHSIVGQHAGTRLAADGVCVQNSQGRWELSLDVKSGSRLHPDAELTASLPDQMQHALNKLQLRGPIGVRGQTKLTLPDAANPQPIIQWDLQLQLEGNRIADAGPVHSIRGELNVRGVRDVAGIRALGQAHVDSLHVDDLQITNINGPFSINDDRLLLGEAGVPIEGRMFDGSVELRGNVLLSTGDFDVDLSARDCRMPTLLADLGHTSSGFSGVFGGAARFEGRLGTMEYLKGAGKGTLSEANLYQLPLIVQVLGQLRITPTEDVAFTDGSVDFSMFGNDVVFNELQLWGDLVALHGSGSMDARQNLDLSFNTRVSPQNIFNRVIQPFGGERYTLWTINVRGPIGSPSIERLALEGVGETLERLFPNIGSASTASRNSQRNVGQRSTRR